MPTSKETVQNILDLLAMPDETRVRPMMGDYVFYYRERVVGGIYDGRLLLKRTPASERLLPDAEAIVPYPGAQSMLAADDLSRRELLAAVFSSMYPEVPAPRPRKARPRNPQAK